MAKFCSNCGIQLNDAQDVCLNCGSIIKKNNSKNEDINITLKAYSGFVLGIVGTLDWFFPLLGFPANIVGIIWCSKGLKSKTYHKKAVAGLVLCIISLVVTFINSFLGALFALYS